MPYWCQIPDIYCILRAMRHQYATRLRIAGLYGLVVVATALLWWGLLSLRFSGAASTGTNESFSTYVWHDPYCIVDPACMSPFHKSTDGLPIDDLSAIPHWQGFEWLGQQGALGIGLEALAIPNLVLFVVVLAALILLLEWRIHKRRLERLLFVAIVSWLVLEVFRWFADISYSDPSVSLVNWESVSVLVVAVGILLAVRATARRLLAHANISRWRAG